MLLRDLLVMFVVIICFAAVISSLSVVSRQSSYLLENVRQEIIIRNEIMIKRVNN